MSCDFYLIQLNYADTYTHAQQKKTGVDFFVSLFGTSKWGEGQISTWDLSLHTLRHSTKWNYCCYMIVLSAARAIENYREGESGIERADM